MGIYEEYDKVVDQRLFESLMEMYIKDQELRNVSPYLQKQVEKAGGSMFVVSRQLYDEFPYSDSRDLVAVGALLNKAPAEVVNDLRNRASIQLYNDLVRTYQANVQEKLGIIQGMINKLQRTYMQAQMEVFKEKQFYPDANSTLRVTYGTVGGYNPRDAVGFDYYTYLDGVMEKYKPGDYEFDVPERLRDLYKSKDYGPYGSNGKMPVCFIARNHTTGGNSGSPALDAYGNLLGLNFDRVWEGTMSDINYDPSICRNIMVDIRYVLFIIDKYAGAGHLVKEMKLVHPKAGR